MKASTGVRTRSAARTVGTAGARTGWNAQCLRGSVTAGPLSVGQGRPCLTHSVSAAIWFAGSFSPSPGMASISFCFAWLIERISRLAAGLPGTTTGPTSPPFRMNSRESSRRPDFCFFGPWQE